MGDGPDAASTGVWSRMVVMEVLFFQLLYCWDRHQLNTVMIKKAHGSKNSQSPPRKLRPPPLRFRVIHGRNCLDVCPYNATTPLLVIPANAGNQRRMPGSPLPLRCAGMTCSEQKTVSAKRGPSDFLDAAHRLDPRVRGDDATLLIADFLTNAA